MASQEVITHTKDYVLAECFACGIPILMTKGQMRAFDNDGATITCVLGHQTIRRESEVQWLQKQLSQAQDRVSTLETEVVNQRGLLQAEAKKRKSLETRVRNGVCPHCQRSFQNVRRHIQSQHTGSA